MKNSRNKGFTLVEIMIVVAIIALLAAIAIPNLLRARLNANEGAAIGNMHTLVAAMGSYQANQSPPSYPSALANLATCTPPYIDSVLGGTEGAAAADPDSSTKQGYQFVYTQGASWPYTYTITASPVVAGKTGNRVFFADESGVIRLNNATGKPIE